MPADEPPGITWCLSLPDAGHWMSAESCDDGTLRLRQCVEWGREAASPYILGVCPASPDLHPSSSTLTRGQTTHNVYLTFMTHLATT